MTFEEALLLKYTKGKINGDLKYTKFIDSKTWSYYNDLVAKIDFTMLIKEDSNIKKIIKEF